jgi:hypothetical protein
MGGVPGLFCVFHKKTPPVVTEGADTGQVTNLFLGMCSGLPFFGRHTGGCRKPVVEFSLKIWIPAYAGMTFIQFSISRTDPT